MNSEQAIRKLAEAKESAALGAEFAPEYIERFGIRFYYKTVSHAWVIPMAITRCKGAGDFEKGLIVLYLLSMTAEEVRNRATQEAADGTLLANAIKFMEEHGISPEDAEQIEPEKLMSHPYKKK